MPKNHARGYLLALTAAILWGVSGTFGQFLFTRRGIPAEWLVTVRLLLAGSLLLLFPRQGGLRGLLPVWHRCRDRIELITFSLFGMLAVQFTYFAAIKHSNAATATVLQYLGPVFIALYYAAQSRRLPVGRELLAIALATSGTFLLVTHGSLDTISLSGAALFWGLASAVALAFYSVQPAGLIERFDPAVVIGWGMLLGGVAASFVHPPWRVSGVWDSETYLAAGFVVIFGSLIPFYAYLTAVKLVGAKTSSLLACTEPLSAALVAVLWLKVSFGLIDWIGTALVTATVVVLVLRPSSGGRATA